MKFPTLRQWHRLCFRVGSIRNFSKTKKGDEFDKGLKPIGGRSTRFIPLWI